MDPAALRHLVGVLKFFSLLCIYKSKNRIVGENEIEKLRCGVGDFSNHIVIRRLIIYITTSGL